MANLSSLPNEIVLRIITFLQNRSSIANFRLVKKHFSVIAAGEYFARVPLYPQWWGHVNEDNYIPFPNDIKYDSINFKNILDHPDLKKLVKKVDIYTCNPDCDHHPDWANGYGTTADSGIFSGYMGSNQLDDRWEECFHRIPEFESLRDVAIIFDRHGGSNESMSDDDETILQSRPQRMGWISRVVDLVGDRLKDLGIRNFQEWAWSGEDYNNEILAANELKRKNMLGQLRSLRMSIVCEQTMGEQGPTLKVGDSHEYWRIFPEKWLAPTASNLRHLTLYSDVPVGWFPRIDLRNIHFANLKSLALGHFLFSHDFQVDWIVSHSKTLRELYFDHCALLFQFGHAVENWLDEEGFPKYDFGGPYSTGIEYEAATFESAVTLKSFGTRWHDIFTRFSDSLPHLQTFRFGSSEQWDFNTPNRRDDGDPGMPKMPWEAEIEMENRLFRERYLRYSDWESNYSAGENDSQDYDLGRWVDSWESPPSCDAEDEKALLELLHKVGNA